MRRVLDFDALTGITTWFDHDPHADVTTITETHDAEPIIERAKSLQNDPEHKRQGIKRSWMHLATIPPLIQVQWEKECGKSLYSREGMAYAVKKLHEPDWKYLKTATGRFIRANRS